MFIVFVFIVELLFLVEVCVVEVECVELGKRQLVDNITT